MRFFLFKFVDFVLFLETVVVEIYQLFVTSLVQDYNFVNIFLRFCHNTFFVNEGKDAHTWHLGDDVIARINSCSKEFPKLAQALTIDASIAKVTWFVETIGLDLPLRRLLPIFFLLLRIHFNILSFILNIFVLVLFLEAAEYLATSTLILLVVI